MGIFLYMKDSENNTQNLRLQNIKLSPKKWYCLKKDLWNLANKSKFQKIKKQLSETDKQGQG